MSSPLIDGHPASTEDNRLYLFFSVLISPLFIFSSSPRLVFSYIHLHLRRNKVHHVTRREKKSDFSDFKSDFEVEKKHQKTSKPTKEDEKRNLSLKDAKRARERCVEPAVPPVLSPFSLFRASPATADEPL